jgi:hypothetical protein
MTMPNGPEVSIVVSRAGSVRRLCRRGRRARCAVGLAAAILAAGGCSSTGAGPAGAGSAGAASTPHPEPAGSSWHLVKQVANSPNGGFTAVVAAGRDGGWAFDGTSTPTAWQRNGSTWTQGPFPGLSDEVVIAAAASSATNVWAFTLSYHEFGKSRALRWDGRHWTVVRSFSQAIGGAVVLSPSDVWVFGSGLGALHYNGRTWTPAASGRGLEDGSGLSASDIWAFDGADVAHWNGSTWSRTSVASLLPAKQLLNNPGLTGIYEQSRHSVYAIANGYEQDANGPLAILHWNGSAWSKVAGRGLGYGYDYGLSSDGHGGLWLPTAICCGLGHLLHYSAGHLTQAGLPGGLGWIEVNAVALIPGTGELLGVGRATRNPSNGADIVGVILQYGT